MVKRLLLAIFVVLLGCSHSASAPRGTAARDAVVEALPPHDAEKLVALTEDIAQSERRVFSFLVSKNGALLYELYTSHLTREHAHYVMSVTKSVTSALMGIAIGEGKVPNAETSVADALPESLFPTPEDRARFRGVRIRDVLAMSALDAQVPPHRMLPEDLQRQKAFLRSPNRTQFALGQALLPEPGKSFQYTDITPQIATGILTYATKETALEYADEHLFGPLEFRNQEWMHEDATGIDNGAYGLRLRPIDMLKLGNLYLQGGRWHGRQIIPEDWVKASFTPWVAVKKFGMRPIYGWYWWQLEFGPGWTAHAAIGWRGQRIAVFPDQGVVVVMTGNIEDDEYIYFERLVRDYVMPALSSPGGAEQGAQRRRLQGALDDLRNSAPRFKGVESRLIPSIEPKETHHPFRPEQVSASP